MTTQLGFLVNADLCIGCHTCGMACKNQYHQDPGIVWRELIPLDEDIYPHRERAWYSLACNHCANPPCVEACSTEAISKREEDGIVILDVSKCEGYQDCIKECPYNVECRVAQEMMIGEYAYILGEVLESHIDEDKADDSKRAGFDMTKVNPLIYFAEAREYWSVGKMLGYGFRVGKEIKINEI